MIITGSLVLVLGLIITLLVRYRIIRVPDLLLCGTFGFLLAGTGAASLIHNVLAWIASIFAAIHP
ncbi:ABC-type uncharacterized transport system permease subunit [Streptacidiphilus sp. MAP12-16]|uniref:hypothetical protein n=1 Tax=Streptacidiphilus sp. MAP12-16 TaxID=3156300 RepID=UPI0035183990